MTSSPTEHDAFDASPLRQALVVLVTVKIAGILLIFDVGGLQAFDFPKSLWSRGLEWLLLGVLVAAVILHGPGIVPRTRLHLVAAGFVLAQAMSALFAENSYIALYGDRDRYLGLTFVIDMAVLYLAVAVGFRRTSDWGVFALAVATAGLMIMAYAWIQYLGVDPVTWSADPRLRPFSTLGQPDHLGHFLSLLFGAGLATAVIPGRPHSLRVAAAALCVLILGTAAVVATRGTLLAVVVVLGVVPLLYLRATAARRQSILLAALIGAAATGLLAATLEFTPLGERLQSAAGRRAVDDRLVLFRAAAQAFADRPLVGYGPDNYAVAFPRYRQRGDAPILGDAYQSSAHDWALQAAATGGSVGLLAAAALAVGSIVALWRELAGPRRGVAAALLLASVAYWVHGLVAVGSITVDWLPWLALGAAASSGPAAARAARTPAGARRRAAAAAPIALCGAMLFSGAAAIAGNQHAGTARQFSATAPDIAIAAAHMAVNEDAGRAEYWNWLGTAYGGASRWHDAAAAYAQATARAPHDWSYWANLARSTAREAAGRPDAVRREALPPAQRAVAVDPNEPLAHIALADVAFAADAFELSLASAVAAVVLDPTRNFDAAVTRAAARATDLVSAKALLEQATAARDTAPLHVALAQVLLKLGDKAGAREQATRALQLSPANADALAVLRAAGG